MSVLLWKNLIFASIQNMVEILCGAQGWKVGHITMYEDWDHFISNRHVVGFSW